MTESRRARSNFLRLPAALLFLVVPLSAAADGGLAPYWAEYKVKVSLLRGKLTTNVDATESGFAARSVIEPTGLANLFVSGRIEEYSEFAAGSGGVTPHHYESVDTLSSDHKRMNFDFDYERRAVTGQINDEEFRFEFDGPVHDRVSIQYELMYNLLNSESGDDYALLDGDELKQLEVEVIGRREVDVPFGRFQAVGVRHREEDSSRVSSLWCVEELGYLPVVIEQHRDGDLFLSAELRKYEPKPVSSPERTADAAAAGE